MAYIFTNISYIEIPSDTAFDGSVGSVAIWINPTSLANSTEFFGRHSSSNSVGGIGLGLAADGTLGFYAKPLVTVANNFNSLGSSPGAISAGAWNHVGISFDKALGGTCSLFKDGAVVASGANAYAWDFFSVPIRIGDSTDGFWTGLVGMIAEVAWWDVKLTGDEFKALAMGACPNEVRPGNVQVYLPLRT